MVYLSLVVLLKDGNRAKGTKLSTSAADIALDGMEITGNNARSKAALAEIDPAKQAIDRQAADIYNSRPNAVTTWDDLTPEARKELTDFYNQEGDCLPARTGDPC